jgi:5'-3' exonuclease
MQHTLVLDLSNLSYISVHYQQRNNQELTPELVLDSMTQFLRQLYRYFAPNKVIFACDSHYYWRKDIFQEYKAHRPETALKQVVKQAIKEFKQKNAHLCIELVGFEADDIIYGVSQYLPDSRITIVSSDGDFVQLISERVRVYDPMRRTYRPKPKHPEFELFVKCIRGDKSDNIPSAYPHVTKKKLQNAFANEAILEKLLQTKLGEVEVAELYYRNRQLIDLSYIPDHLKQQLKDHIEGICCEALV